MPVMSGIDFIKTLREMITQGKLTEYQETEFVISDSSV